MDSGQSAKLTDLENPPGGISWSPDGKQIAFSSLVPAAPPKIAMLPAAPEGAKWADAPKVYEDLIYRFNGPGYLKPGYSQIFVVASDGGAPRQLTTGKFPHGPGAGGLGGSDPSWAPDGKHIAFESNRTGSLQIFSMLADGSKVQQLTRTGINKAPAWSGYIK
jgi:Tol biopolymer transport system component